MTQEEFNDACERYREIFRTSKSWEERRDRINQFRAGYK